MTRRFIIGCITLLLAGNVLAAAPVADTRTSLGMNAEEKAQFLSEMRQMLGSVQGILQGIATEDRALIAQAAAVSGNRMARATPDSLRSRLPQAFKDLGGPTHLLFEELVIRAETDDQQALLRHAVEIMNQCMGCHARFRAD